MSEKKTLRREFLGLKRGQKRRKTGNLVGLIKKLQPRDLEVNVTEKKCQCKLKTKPEIYWILTNKGNEYQQEKQWTVKF